MVLAPDQTGHGYSDPPAFAGGFGGPDGLAHLRSLDIVDKNNIGLEGHSMGGWTVLAAATAMPNDYKSMVLKGSSTGKPFRRGRDPELAEKCRAGVRAIRGIFRPDVGLALERPGRRSRRSAGAPLDWSEIGPQLHAQSPSSPRFRVL